MDMSLQKLVTGLEKGNQTKKKDIYFKVNCKSRNDIID